VAKSEWNFKSAVEQSAALSAKKVSAVELTQDAIARIERHDGKINAVCVRDFDRALGTAREADAALARGERKPLLGLPLAIKESFNIAGLPTTWGFVPQKDFKPVEDALAQAGGVILGKTNVPVGLADWQSYNDIYGTTNNPHDLGRTPGGSSGGSSAALAAGYCALATGSDIGGSLRVPAFHCGVFAHKPTINLCAARGETPPPFPAIPREGDLAVIGPMARTAADLSLLLDVMAGPGPLDAGIAYKLGLPVARHQSLRDFRVVVIDSHPLLPTDRDVRSAIDRLATDLAKAGVTVARESALLPDFAETSRLYMRMLLGFLGAFLPPNELADAQARASQLSPEDRSLGAERLCGITASHRAWVLDAGSRAGLRAQWRALFNSFDAVICPIMPTPAFPHDHLPEQRLRLISIDGKTTLIPTSLPGRALRRFRACLRPPFRSACRKTACRSACRSSAPSSRTARPLSSPS